MNFGQAAIVFALLVVALVLYYPVRLAILRVDENGDVLEVDAPQLVLVSEDSKALYDKLLELGGPDGLPAERISRGAIEFVQHYSGYRTLGNCKLLSAKLVGSVPMPTIVSVDCTYKLHVMGEFQLRGLERGDSRLDCDFLVDLKQEAAVLHFN